MWNKIKNNRAQRRRHVSVRMEIMAIFLVFVVVIMGVCLTIYNQNMSELRQADLDHLTESSRQLAAAANSVVMDMGSLFRIQYEDPKLRNILSSSRQSFDERTRFQNTTYVENTISHAMSDSEYIIRCSLFTAGGDIYSNVSSVYGEYKEYIWDILKNDEIGGSIYYTGLEEWSIGLVERRVVTAIKILYNYNGTTPLAWLVMDINYDKLQELLMTSDDNTGTILLCNGAPIYSDSIQGLSEEQLQQILEKGLLLAEEGKEQEIIRAEGRDYLTTAVKSVNTGWVLVRFVDEKEVLRPTTMRQYRDITLLLLTAVIVFCIYYCRISRMMEPLSWMDRVVRSNGGESLQKVWLPESRFPAPSDNEILNVVRNYNDMVDRMNEYTEKILRYEISQKEAQIKMLTYQINPHFLYNTLNTISAMAEIENMDHIVKITESISNIFRYNLKGEAKVSLREELAHVKDYVQIQAYRFPGRFLIRYDIPEELLEVRIMKFILQPLVENSILHGFSDRARGGEIVVGAKREGDMLLLTVRDNGDGINKRRLEEMNRKLFSCTLNRNEGEEIGADGIGIMNVNARLAGYYGGNCGITMYSVYGEGTETVLRLKIQT